MGSINVLGTLSSYGMFIDESTLKSGIFEIQSDLYGYSV